MSMDVVIPAASGLVGTGVGAVIAERFQSRRAMHERMNAIRVDQFAKARDFAVGVHERHRHLRPLVETLYRSKNRQSVLDPYAALSEHVAFFDNVRTGVAAARYNAVDEGVRFALDTVIEEVDKFDKLYEQIRAEIDAEHTFDAAEVTAAEVDKELPHFTTLTDQVVEIARLWLYESTFERGDGSGYYESWWKRVRKRVNRLLTRTYGG